MLNLLSKNSKKFNIINFPILSNLKLKNHINTPSKFFVKAIPISRERKEESKIEKLRKINKKLRKKFKQKF